MKDSIIAKLESLKERYEELEALLGDVSVISDQINSVRILKNIRNLKK